MSDEHHARGAEAWREAIRGEHLTYEELEAHVDGRADASAHLALCPQCTAEAEDLGAAAEEWSTPAAWWSWPAAAAIALAVLGTLLVIAPRDTTHVVVTTTASTPPVVAPPAPAPPQPPPLDAKLAIVLEQLANGVLPSAALLADLRPSMERTRGGTDAASLRILAPIGVIEETRPRFRWTTRGGATYVVEVFNASYRSVAKSEALRDGEWQPANALQRGETYAWQVTETLGETTITAPVPPQPPARFRILGNGAANELAAARTPLERALICAREGVLDRALDEIESVRDPSPAVLRAKETLRRYQLAPTTANPPQ